MVRRLTKWSIDAGAMYGRLNGAGLDGRGNWLLGRTPALQASGPFDELIPAREEILRLRSQ
jgi:hypothetical protein